MLYVRLLLLFFCLCAVSACSSRQGKETMDTQPVVFESELSCVCPDSAGNFLIGTEEGIIYRYAPGSLEQYRVTNPSNRIYYIEDLGHAGGTDNMLVSVRNRGLHLMRLRGGVLVQDVVFRCVANSAVLPQKGDSYSAYHWVKGDDGCRYLATSNGLWMLRREAVERYVSMPPDKAVEVDSVALFSTKALMEKVDRKYQYTIESIELRGNDLYFASQDGLWYSDMSAAAPKLQRISDDGGHYLHTEVWGDTLYALSADRMLKFDMANRRMIASSPNVEEAQAIFFHVDEETGRRFRYSICASDELHVEGKTYRGLQLTKSWKSSFQMSDEGVYLISGRRLMYLDFDWLQLNFGEQATVGGCCLSDDGRIYVVDSYRRLFRCNADGTGMKCLGEVEGADLSPVVGLEYAEGRLLMATRKNIYEVSAADYLFSVGRKARPLFADDFSQENDHEITAFAAGEGDGLWVGTRKCLYRCENGSRQEIPFRLTDGRTLAELYESAYITDICHYGSGVEVGTLNWLTGYCDGTEIRQNWLEGVGGKSDVYKNVRSVAFSPDRRMMLAAAQDSVYIYRTETDGTCRALAAPLGLYANSLSFLSDSLMVATTGKGVSLLHYSDADSLLEVRRDFGKNLYFQSAIKVGDAVFCSSRYGLFLLSPENGSYSLRQLDLDAGTLSLSTVVWSVLLVILLLALLLLLARCHKRAELLRRFRRDVLRYSELPLQRFERLVGLRLLFARKFRTRLNETEARWSEWVAHCRDWRRLMKGSEYSLTAEKEAVKQAVSRADEAGFQAALSVLERVLRLTSFESELRQASLPPAFADTVQRFVEQARALDASSDDFERQFAALRQEWNLIAARRVMLESYGRTVDELEESPLRTLLTADRELLERRIAQGGLQEDATFEKWVFAIKTYRKLNLLTFDADNYAAHKAKFLAMTGYGHVREMEESIEAECRYRFIPTQQERELLDFVRRVGVVEMVDDKEKYLEWTLEEYKEHFKLIDTDKSHKIVYLKQKERLKTLVADRLKLVDWMNGFLTALGEIRCSVEGRQGLLYEGQQGEYEQSRRLLSSLYDCLTNAVIYSDDLFRESDSGILRRYVANFTASAEEYLQGVRFILENGDELDRKIGIVENVVERRVKSGSRKTELPSNSIRLLKETIAANPFLQGRLLGSTVEKLCGNTDLTDNAEMLDLDGLKQCLSELEKERDALRAIRGSYRTVLGEEKNNRFFNAFFGSLPELQDPIFRTGCRQILFSAMLVGLKARTPKALSAFFENSRLLFFSEFDRGDARAQSFPYYLWQKRRHPVVRAWFTLLPTPGSRMSRLYDDVRKSLLSDVGKTA